MTFTMFDSVNLEHVPNNASMVAGYVNGYWPTYHDVVLRFPLAHHVSIAVTAGVVADVLDVERGDAVPADVPLWVKEMRNLHRKPIIYTSRSVWASVQAECAKAAVAEPFWWCADWTNQPHLVPGSIGTQWADGTATYPGLAPYCDTSLISPNWPGLGSPNPTEAQLLAAKLVLVPDKAHAELALSNGHPLKTWNGNAFVAATPAEPLGTHEYANTYYERKRP